MKQPIPECIKNIEDVVKDQIATDKESIGKILTDNKVLLSLTKGFHLTVKVIKTQFTPRKSIHKISSEDVSKIKTAKRVLKNNLDALYLYTLLIRVKDTLPKVNIGQLPIEGALLIKETYTALSEKMNNVSQISKE